MSITYTEQSDGKRPRRALPVEVQNRGKNGGRNFCLKRKTEMFSCLAFLYVLDEPLKLKNNAK